MLWNPLKALPSGGPSARASAVVCEVVKSSGQAGLAGLKRREQAGRAGSLSLKAGRASQALLDMLTTTLQRPRLCAAAAAAGKGAPRGEGQ